MMILPVRYKDLLPAQKREVRAQYTAIQNGLCMYCKGSLSDEPLAYIKAKKINWNLFPKGFMNYPVHLQHCHKTGMTEGVVHAYCNAVMWQYHNR
jgi:hypothetical protein